MRALVLSGGGARGAFQAGAIYGLAKRGYSWDVIAGVSVGALNGALMAQFPPSNHLGAAIRLCEMWLGLKGNGSVYKNWLFGPLAGLWKGGVFNTAPLRKLIYANLRPEALKASGVRLRIGAVSFETGEYKYVTEQTENLGEWVMASSAFPCAFPPVKIDDQTWMDGGVRDITPVKDIADIVGRRAVDVVLTASVNGVVERKDGRRARNVVDVGLRSLDLMGNEVFRNDFEKQTGVNLVGAASSFKFPSPLDFSPDSIGDMVAHGEEVASRIKIG